MADALDDAVVTAISEMEDAKDADAEADVIARMLRVLRDPLTSVERDASAPRESNVPPVRLAWNRDVLVASMSVTNYDQLQEARAALAEPLRKARAVVFDVRATDPSAAEWTQETLQTLGAALANQPLLRGGARELAYSGYPSQTNPMQTTYVASSVTRAPRWVQPDDRQHPGVIVLLANRGSRLPDFTDSLQRSGVGILVADDGADALAGGAETVDLPASEGWHVHMRATETSDPIPDIRVSARALGDRDAGLEAAIEAARAPSQAHRALHPELPPAASAAWKPDGHRSGPPLPPRAERLFALFRLSQVIRLFHGYRARLGDIWCGAFAAAVPELVAARTDMEYTKAIARVAAQIPDAHVKLRGTPAVRALFGERLPGVTLRSIDDAVVVTRVDDLSARARGLAPGDIVLTLDGRTVHETFLRLAPFVSSSRPELRNARLALFATAGPPGSVLDMGVQRTDGTAVHYDLPRVPQKDASETIPYAVVAPHVGYIDVSRLDLTPLDGALAALSDARTLIVDLRRYPRSSAGSVLARRLASGAPRAVSQSFVPLVRGTTTDERLATEETLVPLAPHVNVDRVIALIDETTVSAGEYNALLLEGAAPTTFVGSPTLGAIGDVTDLALPGGIVVAFSGMDVRHADGRAVQGVGIEPDVLVVPTVSGIRAGHDDVRERAMALASTPAPSVEGAPPRTSKGK